MMIMMMITMLVSDDDDDADYNNYYLYYSRTDHEFCGLEDALRTLRSEPGTMMRIMVMLMLMQMLIMNEGPNYWKVGPLES